MIEEIKKKKIDLYVLWDKEDVEQRLHVIKERAKRLVEEFYRGKPMYGYAPSTLAAATLYISSCITGYAGTLKDIASLSGRGWKAVREAHDDILHQIVKRYLFREAST